MFCTNCGKELTGNEKFCTECGQPMTVTQTARPVEPAAQAQQPAAPAQPYTQPAPQAYAANATQQVAKQQTQPEQRRTTNAAPAASAAQQTSSATAQKASVCTDPFEYRDPFKWSGFRKVWLKGWAIILTVIGSLLLLGNLVDGGSKDGAMIALAVAMLAGAAGCSVLYRAKSKIGFWIIVGGFALSCLSYLPDVGSVFLISLINCGLPLGTYFIILRYWKRLS